MNKLDQLLSALNTADATTPAPAEPPAPHTTRVCATCGHEKPLTPTYWAMKDGRVSRRTCRDCVRTARRHPDKRSRYSWLFGPTSRKAGR